MTHEPLPELPSIGTVLVATDFSESADAALGWAIEIAHRHGARLELVHAIESGPMESVPLDLQRAAECRLEEHASTVREAGVEARTTCRPGRAWEVVREAECDLGADLVVIGSRGRTS
ncbi:MAG: universal stress protein, partial [Planctomycetota bacterium]